MNIANTAVPISFVLFVVLVVVLPLLRQRLRAGIWAVVVRRSGGDVERFVRWWTLGLFGAAGLWAVLVPSLSAERLAIWAVPAPVAGLGMVALGLGFALMAAAQAQMGLSWRIGIDDDPTELVVHGLFEWVRHPIYTGVLTVFAGLVLLTPSPWTVSGLVLVYVLIAIQSRLEDEHMRAQHGADFTHWAARVGRFLPRVHRLTPRAGT